MLEEYEEKLGLFAKFQERDQLLSSLRELLNSEPDNVIAIIDRLENME